MLTVLKNRVFPALRRSHAEVAGFYVQRGRLSGRPVSLSLIDERGRRVDLGFAPKLLAELASELAPREKEAAP